MLWAAMAFPSLSFRLPPWFSAALEKPPNLASVEDRVLFAIELARRNVREGTGGPFGAAVLERDTGRLLGAGVNLVTFAGCSLLHAELVALALAQQAAGTYDLGAPGLPACQLVSTVDPCAMCLAALPWAGVAELVCGAAEEDARAIGFDEGDKPADWVGGLRSRGLRVVRGVLAEECRAVLRDYAAAGGVIYNGRAAGPASAGRRP